MGITFCKTELDFYFFGKIFIKRARAILHTHRSTSGVLFADVLKH